MTLSEMTTLVIHWFAVAHEGGLVLPDGWFGRPYDTFWQLEKAEAVGHDFVLNLTGNGVLIFASPRLAQIRNSELVIEGFSNMVFQWREFGGNHIHQKEYDFGEFRFIPRVGSKIA